MRFRYIAAQCGFGRHFDHIAVPASAEKILTEISDALVGTDDLLAIYIPKNTQAGYPADDMRGKVVGGVSLVNMPTGKGINDYFCDDLEKRRRWPIGWPCVAVLRPPVDECPSLEYLVEMYHGSNSSSYAARLCDGPIQLDWAVSNGLSRWFTRLAAQSIDDRS
jgi:hypothetical protein